MECRELYDAIIIYWNNEYLHLLLQTLDNEIFYIKDKWITAHNCSNDSCVAITAARRSANAMSSGPRSLMLNPLNPSEINILVFYVSPTDVHHLKSLMYNNSHSSLYSMSLFMYNNIHLGHIAHVYIIVE